VSKAIRVFVYGTLKEGYGNHRALAGSKALGRAVIAGKYSLVDMGWYPGVLDHSADSAFPERRIGGEVYEIDDDTLNTLDMIEGHPSFYCREKVRTPYGKAWAYLLPPRGREHHNKVETTFWRQTDEEAAWLSADSA
jgi:gamma-glutamylaminecyclotransferase